MPYASARPTGIQRTRRITVSLGACIPLAGAVFGDFWGPYILLRNNVSDFFDWTFIMPTDWVSPTNLTLHLWFTNGGPAGPVGNIRIGLYCGALLPPESTTVVGANIANDVRHTVPVQGAEVTVEDTYVLNGALIGSNEHLWFALYRYGADPLDTCNINVGAREVYVEYTADS